MKSHFVNILLFLTCINYGFGQKVSPLCLRVGINGDLNIVVVTRYFDLILNPFNGYNFSDSLSIFGLSEKRDTIQKRRLRVYDFETGHFQVNASLPQAIRRFQPFEASDLHKDYESCDCYVDTIPLCRQPGISYYDTIVWNGHGNLKPVMEYHGKMPDSVKKSLPAKLRLAAIRDKGEALSSEITPYPGYGDNIDQDGQYSVSRLIFYNYAKEKLVSVISYCEYYSIIVYDSLKYNRRGQLVYFHRYEGSSGSEYHLSYNRRKKVSHIQCLYYYNDKNMNPKFKNFVNDYHFRYGKQKYIKLVRHSSGGSARKLYIRKITRH